MIRGWGARSDRGSVRKVNEDALVAWPPIFLVADGMGGHAAGDVASRIAAEQFERMVGHEVVSVADAISAIEQANKAIVQCIVSDPTRAGMGTTIAVLAVVRLGGSEHWLVLNVGASRVNRLAGGGLQQMTSDHSEAEEMVAAGRLSPTEARHYLRRHVVTRALGTDPAPQVDSWIFPPEPGDRFLVCTDGLTNELDDDEISHCLKTQVDPRAAAEQLVRRAIAAGGRDNVTVIVVDGPPLVEVGMAEDTVPRHQERSPSI